jgi:sodium transport system permease protein
VVLVVSLLPLVSVFNLGSEAAWHLWLPALGQNTLMTRVLKGEELNALQWLVPLGVGAAVTLVSLRFVARRLRDAAAH